MVKLKTVFCGIVCSVCLYSVQAQNGRSTNEKSVVVSGNIGVSASFYTSSELKSAYSRQDLSWNTYGNFALSRRYFSMPVSYVISQYGARKTSRFSQFGISPAYKWATLHLGDRYTYFSPLIFLGQNFRGIGVDLKPGKFRFSAFYGRLNKAIDDTSMHVGDTVPRYPALQYACWGYGIKIGVGNQTNYFNIMYFHAKDDSTSASLLNIPHTSESDKIKRDSLRRMVPARENAVAGATFRLKIVKKIYLAGDMALSGLTRDLSGIVVDRGFVNTIHLPFHALIKSLYKPVSDNLIRINVSSVFSYASQSSVSFSSRHFSSLFSYRRVAPDFKSLGTPYLTDDIEQVSFINNLSVLKGRLNISTNVSQQHNNLNKKKDIELRTLVGTVNVNAMVSRHFNVNMIYSGYSLINRAMNVLIDGKTINIGDSLKKYPPKHPLLNQQISQFNFTPAYYLTSASTVQSISGNVNISELKSNHIDTSHSTSKTNKNFHASLNYNVSLQRKPLNFLLNGLYNQYKVDSGSYTSYGITGSAAVQLLKKRNLNIQGSAGCFFNHYNQHPQHNFTYSINIGYQGRNHHSFNLFGNCVFTPHNAINDAINNNFSSSVTSTNLAGGIAYNYNF